MNFRKAEPYPSDAPWKARARAHQSWFRENVLMADCAPNIGRREETHYYGNMIYKEDAARGLNFFQPFWPKIKKVIGSTNTALCTNLLRSEHIPYNIFFPMSWNLEATAELMRNITGRDIAEVNDIRIEWPKMPSMQSNEYINDRTAFDTFIEYKDNDGRTCGIGIEVKYTEKGYPIGIKEEKMVNDETSAYHLVTKESECYEYGELTCSDFIKKVLAQHDYRQIWRNHMLGIAMVQKGALHSFLSVHLYPKFNEHFQKVVPEYQAMQSEAGKATFMPLTYESLFLAMEQVHFSDVDKQWLDYLRKRYIDF